MAKRLREMENNAKEEVMNRAQVKLGVGDGFGFWFRGSGLG